MNISLAKLMVDTKSNLSNIPQASIHGFIKGTAAGLLSGKMLQSGLVGTVMEVAKQTLRQAVDIAGKEIGCKPSNIKATKLCVSLVADLALVTTLVSMGVIGALGITLLGALSIYHTSKELEDIEAMLKIEG